MPEDDAREHCPRKSGNEKEDPQFGQDTIETASWASWMNPEILLNDYPPDVRKKHGPMSERSKRQRVSVAIVIGAWRSAMSQRVFDGSRKRGRRDPRGLGAIGPPILDHQADRFQSSVCGEPSRVRARPALGFLFAGGADPSH